MTARSFSRRDLLRLGGLIALGTLVPVTARRTLLEPVPRDQALASIQVYVNRLSAMSVSFHGLRRLGLRAVRELPSQPSLVLQNLERIYGSPGDLEALNDAQLRRALAEASARDFAARRTILVDGWLLSHSEANVAIAFDSTI